MGNIRRWSVLGAGCAALVLVAGCNSGGTGPGAAAAPTGGGARSTSTTDPDSNGPGCHVVRLVSCLMPAPPSSAAWHDQWAPNGAITVAQYANEFYSSTDGPTPTTVTRELAADGLKSIVHRDWQGPNDDSASVDVLLESFATGAGAAAWAKQNIAATTAAQGSDSPSRVSLDVPGVTAYSYPIDSDGYVQGEAIGQYGTVVMDLYYDTPQTLDQDGFRADALLQKAILPSS